MATEQVQQRVLQFVRLGIRGQLEDAADVSAGVDAVLPRPRARAAKVRVQRDGIERIAALVHSDEYLATIVRPAYVQFLGRDAEPAGLVFWIGEMQALAVGFVLGAVALVCAVWWEEICAVRGAQAKGQLEPELETHVADAAMGASRDRLEHTQ